MKTLRLTTVLALAIAITGVAVAGCPDSGYFFSLDGTMMTGRASEAWCGADGNPVQGGQPGNTENAESWDGSVLGTQWKIWGMAIDATGAVQVASDIDGFGNGWIDYETNYVGGEFWMSGDHTWSIDGMDLTGVITQYNVLTRMSYFFGDLVGATSNIYMQGTFDDCDECIIENVVANGCLDWHPDFGGNPPANYPPYLCDTDMGELFSVCTVSCTISCNGVATEGETWGGVKSLFR
jgi:hypothetical protein